MKQVLFLSYHFPPIGGAGVQRPTRFATYLRDFGYEPIVISSPGPTGARWLPADETLANNIPADLEIHRMRGPEPLGGNRVWAQLSRVLMLPGPWARWLVEEQLAAARAAAAAVDLIYTWMQPYESARVGETLARELGKPWVADLGDPWALDEMLIYATALHRGVDRRRMRIALNAADAVVMSTPESVKRVRASFPELQRKLMIAIPNGYDRPDFESPAPRPDESVFRIVHTGYLHTDLGRRQRGLGRLRRLLGGEPVPGVDLLPRSHVYLLQAVKRLLQRDPGLETRLQIVLAGVLSDADREVAASSPVVRMPGFLPHGETVKLVRSADLLFLPMQDLPVGQRAGLIPGKTYEYLASGRPILAAVPDGDARDLLERSGTAFVCRPKDVDAMADVIRGLVERKARGDEPSATEAGLMAPYEYRTLAAQLASVFDSVTAGAIYPAAVAASENASGTT